MSESFLVKAERVRSLAKEILSQAEASLGESITDAENLSAAETVSDFLEKIPANLAERIIALPDDEFPVLLEYLKKDGLKEKVMDVFRAQAKLRQLRDINKTVSGIVKSDII